jgi:branched-chain amino acid transport system substrate-binding protein
MKRNCLKMGVLFMVLSVFLFVSNAFAVDKVLLGHPACLSGKLSKEGSQASWGVKACVKWINEVNGGIMIGGKKVPLVYKAYDCETKKEMVTSLIGRIATVDKVNGIIAPYSSGLTLTGAAVAEKYGIPYFSQGGASNRIFEQGFQYAVQVLSPATLYQDGALEMIRGYDPDAKRLALVFQDSEFARMVLLGAANKATQLGFRIVFNRTYPTNVTDMTPLLSDLKATKPEIIIGGGHFPDGQLMARQLADLDINAKAVSMIVAVTLPAFYKALGAKAEGMVGPAQWEFGVKYSPEAAKKKGEPWYGPTNEQFEKFVKEFSGGTVPDYHAAEAGQAPLVFAKAVETANSVDPDKIRDACNQLEFMSFFGDFKIDPKTGLNTKHSMVTVQWQGGKKVIVWPPSAAQGKLYYPMPTFAQKAEGTLAVPK